MGKEGFKGLKVWEKGKDLAVFIYRVTERGSFSKDYSFKDQIRRAAISIPSNIAEGDALGSDKQAARYLHIAKGSTAEVMTQANIAFEVGIWINQVSMKSRNGVRRSSECFMD